MSRRWPTYHHVFFLIQAPRYVRPFFGRLYSHNSISDVLRANDIAPRPAAPVIMSNEIIELSDDEEDLAEEERRLEVRVVFIRDAQQFLIVSAVCFTGKTGRRTKGEALNCEG